MQGTGHDSPGPDRTADGPPVREETDGEKHLQVAHGGFEKEVANGLGSQS